MDELPATVTGPVLAASPHLDDAVLSVGATLARMATDRLVTVATVFAGDPQAPLSPVARRHHLRCGLGRDAVAVRRDEDRHAMARLGVVPHHGELPDAVYRRRPDGRWVCNADEDMFAAPPLDPDLDAAVLALVVEAIDAVGAGLLLGPADIGSHVDHVITREAVLRAAAARALPVLLWQDQPYATATPPPERGPVIHVRYTDTSLEAKLGAIGCYASQLAVLWPAGQDWRTRVAGLGRLDGRGPGEVFHRVAAS